MNKKLNFKIAVAQMRPRPGNIRVNLATILGEIAKAKTAGAKMIVFPELCTTGYMFGDRWEHESFMREVHEANETIRAASEGIVVVWGSVRADWDRIGEDGRTRKYNAAFIAHEGRWLHNGVLSGWIPKTNLPKYRIFDDARHFYPATKLFEEMRKADRAQDLWQLLQPFRITIDGETYRIGLAVCEDLWEDEYFAKPSKIYNLHGVDLLIDISQSPWTFEKWHARDGMLGRRVRDAKAPILYVNAVGLQNNGKNLVWFDGGSTFIDAQGSIRWREAPHQEGLFILDANPDGWQGPVIAYRRGIGEIYDALIAAMREYFASFPKIVIGLSGGIDSAVMLALLVIAVGREKVIPINMPTQYNSQTTRSLAKKCAENFGVEYRVVPIQRLFKSSIDALVVGGITGLSNLTLENIQARLRGHVLASIAQSVGGVFTNNGNKTEIALNYFTLYGDGAGAASFLGDLWKGQVYALARFINELLGYDAIPQGILDVVPSAELSHDQNVDEGKGDPIFYPYHDNLLRMFIEKRWTPVEVLQSAHKGELEKDLSIEPGTIARFLPTRKAFVANLEWAWNQFNIEFKRVQLPPVFLTSRRAFGFDRRETIADAYLPDEYYRQQKAYLQVA